jgi:hypothetical protein
VVVNSRIGHGGIQLDWAWWKTVELGVVVYSRIRSVGLTVGLGMVVNSRIGRGGIPSDWSWW